MQRKNEVRKERIVKGLPLLALSAKRKAAVADLLKLAATLLLIIIGALTWPKQVEATSLSLTWTDDLGDADGFKIERSVDSSYAQIATVGADVRSYTDPGLTGGTIYCYRMKAFNNVGDSDYSDEACATALDGGTPTVPGAASLISPSGTISTTTPTYTWNAVTGATWYLLWVEDRSGAWIAQWYTAFETGCASGTCSITPSTALAEGVAQWSIETWNDAGSGPWSDAGLFWVTSVGGSPPGKATLIAPSGTITTSTSTFTWNAVAKATWYRLWVGDMTGTRIDQWYHASSAGCASGTCSVTSSAALAGGTAQWSIKTWNSAGVGPWSSAMGFTVTP